MTVLIDSWSWIEYWKGGRYSDDVGRYIEGNEEAIVSTINLAEVYHWILRFYDSRIAEQKMAVIQKRCYMIPVEFSTAVEAAKIKNELHLALADSLILATARQSGAKVLTGDPDFKQLKETIFIGE